MPSEKRSIVSLFAGCGGLDLGFVGGFKFAGHKCRRLPHEIIWANEEILDAAGRVEPRIIEDYWEKDSVPDSVADRIAMWLGMVESEYLTNANGEYTEEELNSHLDILRQGFEQDV